MTKKDLMEMVVRTNSQSHNIKSGGQTVGIIARDVILELDGQIKIEIGFFRNIHQNLELANILMELAIDEVLNKTSK
jgi:hypothetical protein